MLGHRLRRWPNIETALGECPLFPGVYTVKVIAITLRVPFCHEIF